MELFAHVITSVNSLCSLYAPVVTMVTSVSSPAPLTCCMVMSAVVNVPVVSMVTVPLLMDHVTVIQDMLDQPAIQVC